MSVSVEGFVGGQRGEAWIFRTVSDDAAKWAIDTHWNASLHVMGSRTYQDWRRGGRPRRANSRQPWVSERNLRRASESGGSGPVFEAEIRDFPRQFNELFHYLGEPELARLLKVFVSISRRMRSRGHEVFSTDRTMLVCEPCIR